MDRPLCKCHDEPMLKDGHFRNKQKWQCRIMERARQAHLYAQPAHRAKKRAEMADHYFKRGGRERQIKRYEQRKSSGICTKCGGPLLSESLCWDCLNYLEERYALSI